LANERGAADRGSTGPSEATPYSAEWSTFARRVAAIVLLVALVFAATLVRPILVAAILAAILAFLLSYVIRTIARHTRASYPLAVALVSIAYLVIGTLALFAVGVPTARFFGDLAAGARPTIESFVTFLASYTPEQGWVTLPATGERVNLDFVLAPLSDLVRSGGTPNLRDLASPALALVGGTAATLGSLIGIILIADVLAITFLFEAPAAGRAALRACPPNHRRELGILALAIQSIWAGYFRATIVCGALLGALTAIQLLLMGIPGAFVIGAFTAIVSVVPIIGGFIALVPIGLAPLIDGSTVLPLDRWSLALLWSA
jgi:predicted PurR-regulated permease PerM